MSSTRRQKSVKPRRKQAKPDFNHAARAPEELGQDLLSLLYADAFANAAREKKVKALIAKGARVDLQDRHGNTPLILAAWTPGADGVLKALVAAGAPLEQQEEFGFTALMMAASHGDATAVYTLLDAGADPERKNKKGKTAFDMAFDPFIRQVLDRAVRDKRRMEAHIDAGLPLCRAILASPPIHLKPRLCP